MRKIYAIAKELGLDSELLHTFIFNLTAEQHISALTKDEAVKIIDELEFRKTGIRKNKVFKDNRANMATKEQLYKITSLEAALGWKDNPKRLKGFMKKYTGVENVNWLTFLKASNLIEAMKKMAEKK